jgi:antitoxin (DNA-binding transcriptional repressor) of toxin-antitoxin stability system
VSVAEAKARFSELIDRVQQGERFVIARRAVEEIYAARRRASDRPAPELG